VTPRNLRFSTFNLQPITLALLLVTIATVHSAPTPTYSFDDGQIPIGTGLTPTGTSGINPGLGVTNAGGFQNTGMLLLTVPASGQTFGEWTLPDLALGQPVTNLSVSFLLYLGQGSGGNAGVPRQRHGLPLGRRRAATI
jgi:hypothetical protein